MGNLHLSWVQRRFFKIYLSDIHADHSIRDYSKGKKGMSIYNEVGMGERDQREGGGRGLVPSRMVDVRTI